MRNGAAAQRAREARTHPPKELPSEARSDAPPKERA